MVSRLLPKKDEDVQKTPDWLMVLWFDAPLPKTLWDVLNGMPLSPFMPEITNGGANCTLFVNTQNKNGKLRKWSSRFSAPGQHNPYHPWLPSDVISDSFADFSKRSRTLDDFLSSMLTAKDQWLTRPPPWGKNLQGDSTCSAYAEIDGADFLEGYRVMRG